ncbi:MAG: nucleoside kinase [Candidatus Coatesbacteria bacterium]|nr:nucleoside kinase [Candidatus Coatesbacteria bacterium]
MEWKFEGKSYKSEEKKTGIEVLEYFGMDPARNLYMALSLDGEAVSLQSELERGGEIKPLTFYDHDGRRTYQNGLLYLLVMAAEKLFPQMELRFNHTLGQGLYGEPDAPGFMTNKELDLLTAEIESLVKMDLKFEPIVLSPAEAAKLLLERGRTEKARVIANADLPSITLYKLADRIDYYYGPVIMRTSQIKNFELVLCPPGFYLKALPPDKKKESQAFFYPRKLFSAFVEYEVWSEIMDVRTIDSLNSRIEKGTIRDVIQISEAFHEKKIASIADKIYSKKDRIKIILISGPSASGKTTFSKRLSIQLQVVGLQPETISLDSYFRSREETPKDEKGEYDFESLEAIDIPLFNRHLQTILAGENVRIPEFDFKQGSGKPGRKMIRLPSNGVLIVEGIHGLNPALLPEINPRQLFRIYVSALTQLNLDRHNRIPTTDTRRLRRTVRDASFRGYTASDTLSRWPSIARGEEKYIFPFQEEADAMFNSALPYEWSLLKSLVQPLLEAIEPGNIVYGEAKRLLCKLAFIKPIDSVFIPPTSILREFIGGSSFQY